jgi:hypothetical protein
MGIIDGADLAAIKNTTEQDLEDMSVPNATVTLTETADPTLGDRVSATVDVDFDDVSWLPASYIGLDAFPLSSTCTMRKESVQ